MPVARSLGLKPGSQTHNASALYRFDSDVPPHDTQIVLFSRLDRLLLPPVAGIRSQGRYHPGLETSLVLKTYLLESKIVDVLTSPE
jgi:hypothetical protein